MVKQQEKIFGPDWDQFYNFVPTCPQEFEAKLQMFKRWNNRVYNLLSAPAKPKASDECQGSSEPT